jgi:hypothetical protein
MKKECSLKTLRTNFLKAIFSIGIAAKLHSKDMQALLFSQKLGL